MNEEVEIQVRQASRALARAGLVGPYGHCSSRLNQSEMLVCAAKPMGTIRPGEDGTVVPISGTLPDGVLGEVRVHQQIYQRRPDVNAICRIIPPRVQAMSVLGRSPKARHGFSVFFYPEPPFFDDPTLMRSDEVASAVADKLGSFSGVILRANGAVVVGANIKQAVTLGVFLEEMCTIELAVLAAGESLIAPLLSEAEAAGRRTWAGRVAERMWDYLTDGDPESA